MITIILEWLRIALRKASENVYLQLLYKIIVQDLKDIKRIKLQPQEPRQTRPAPVTQSASPAPPAIPSALTAAPPNPQTSAPAASTQVSTHPRVVHHEHKPKARAKTKKQRRNPEDYRKSLEMVRHQTEEERQAIIRYYGEEAANPLSDFSVDYLAKTYKPPDKPKE